MSSNHCKVQFWKDKNNGGKTKVYEGPASISDLEDEDWKDSNDDMKDDIGSIRTDSQAWVRVYSKADFGGRSALIGPSTDIDADNLYDDVEDEDLDDTIESFQLYNERPIIDIANYQATFHDQFPHGDVSRKNNLYNTEFYSQDSEYRVYDPEIEFSGDIAYFTIRTDHVQAESDDHAIITFSLDRDGNFVDTIQVTYSIASATQIPEWAVKVMDLGIKAGKSAAKTFFDGAVIVVTDGVGVVFTVEINKVIDFTAMLLTFCVDHMNTVLNAAFVYQDDGGTMNFSAVVSHIIARAVKSYNLEALGQVSSSLKFDKDEFQEALGKSSWHDDDKHTRYLNYKSDGENYRVYKPETTLLYANGGAVISCKIDAITNNQKDDHLILQAVFDPSGHLFSAMGAVDIFSRNHDDGYTAPASGVVTFDQTGQMVHITQDKTITPISYNDLDSAYADLMLKDLQAKDSSFDLDLDDQQLNLVEVSQDVLKAMIAGFK